MVHLNHSLVFLKSKAGKHALKDCRLPRYLPKDGYTTLVIGFVRLKGNSSYFHIQTSFKKTHKAVEITIPPILLDKKVKEIRIIPKADARFFEIQEVASMKLNAIKENLNKIKCIWH